MVFNISLAVRLLLELAASKQSNSALHGVLGGARSMHYAMLVSYSISVL